MSRASGFLPVLAVGLLLAGPGCESSKQELLATDSSQVALRSIQTRAFDSADESKMLRAIMSTLQDLGFVIDRADRDLGSVTGTKLDGYTLRMTVTVRERGESQLLVRASAQYELHAVSDPEPYQRFFEALSKAIFLEAHQVE